MRSLSFSVIALVSGYIAFSAPKGDERTDLTTAISAVCGLVGFLSLAVAFALIGE